MHRTAVAMVLAMLCLGVALPAQAKKPPASPAPDPTPPPAAVPTPAPAPPPVKAVDPGTPTRDLLADAHKSYDNLDFDDVVRITGWILARPNVPAEQQLDAYQLQGSALAGSDQAIDAERPFRLLLRLRSDYDLPKSTQPKIMAVFRKVQAEEKELTRQTRELSREATVKRMALLGNPPEKGFGGYPVRFDFRLRDPTNAVESVVVPFRKQGDTRFDSVALRREDSGDWRGTLTGDLTVNPSGMKLEYYVETRDSEGSLVTLGSADKPLLLEVTAGTTVRERPPPLSPWVFWTLATTTVVLGAGTATAALLTSNAQSNYTSYVNGSGALSASTIQSKAQAGQHLATVTNVGIGATAVSLVATGVVAFFVNWSHVPDPRTDP